MGSARQLRRLFQSVALGILAVALVSVSALPKHPGIATAAPGSSQPKAVLRMAIKSAITNMDGMIDGNTANNAVIEQVVEPLLNMDEKGNIKPHLAVSWSASQDDPSVWTFKLRPGVVFHDGSPFNAQAVAASFRRLKSPEFKLSRGIQYYRPLVSVTAVDNLTVQVKTDGPWGILPVFMTYVASAVVGPPVANQPKVAVPIGTGPFKFAEWKPGEFVRFVRNERYWGPAPFFDEVVIFEIPEDSTRVAKLLAGEVDLITDVPPVEEQRLRRARGVVVRNDPTDRVMWLQFNVRRKPFDDRRVRRAIKHAINVDAIAKGVLKGQAQSADSLAAPGVFGYLADLNYHEYNPDKAKALLAEAGYPNGFSTSITFGSPRYPLHEEILTAIQAQLAEAGIRVKLNKLEWGVYLATIRKPLEQSELEMNSWAWSSVVGDISFLISANFLPEGLFAPSCCNTMFWANKNVGELFKLSQQETDTNRRLRLLGLIQQIINQELPQVHLFVYRQLSAHVAGLEGLVMPPNGEWVLTGAKFRR